MLPKSPLSHLFKGPPKRTEVERGRGSMDWKAEMRCKKHPNHKAEGVYPICLTERLDQLSLSSSKVFSSSSSSIGGSSFSSVSVSTVRSPNTRLNPPPLGRSQSMAVQVKKNKNKTTVVMDQNKRTGFWSRASRFLLRLDSDKKRRKHFSASRT
ncbi:hypothetical protein QJS10_CPA09g00602 [Acorus calamus]|uniref:Uncharacterized protein n=1 Tax=Acorus calamus TaxID=4465 RepID=A0AAV9E4D7_ACOCL|nr:hypothetical protein QJS10_CPA09g00602 [Acorus calamus]